LRRGDARTFPVAALIGFPYAGIGGFGLVPGSGDPFMAFFVALGAVLLLSGYALTTRSPAADRLGAPSAPVTSSTRVERSCDPLPAVVSYLTEIPSSQTCAERRFVVVQR